MPTSRPTLFCLCKPFSSQGCPGNAPHDSTAHHITSPHITPHHITLHHSTSHHITVRHSTSHHLTPHHSRSYHIASHHMTSHRITSHHTMTLYTTSHHITLHHMMSLYTTPVESRTRTHHRRVGSGRTARWRGGAGQDWMPTKQFA